MSVLVNGVSSDGLEGSTVAALVEAWNFPTRGIAIAVNGEIIRRGEWATTTLTTGDAVEVVTAAAGG